MASLMRGSGGSLLRGPNGALARGRSCCCSIINCCCDLWGKDLKATFQWGCPAEADPAALVITLTWNGIDKCWRGTKTGYCTSPANFTIEVLCADVEPGLPPTLSFPVNGGVCSGFMLVRIYSGESTSGWRRPGCPPSTIVDAFNGVLSDSSCCVVSPGALVSITLEVA